MRCVGVLLPTGKLLEWREEGDAIVLTDGDDVLRLQGMFADALRAWASAGHTGVLLRKATHPWLSAIAKGAKALYASEQDSAHAVLSRPLALLFVELTARCQERCLHCYADSSPERDETLPAQLALKVVEEAALLGVRAVQFTGGDPLLHPALPLLARHAHELGLLVEVFTNGLALSSRLLDRLALAHARLCFSLYAFNPEVHDAITRLPGSFARTWRAIEQARDAGLDVRIGIVAMEENEEEIPATVDALVAAGFAPEDIRIDFVRAVGRGRTVRPARRLAVVPLASHRPERGAKLCIAADGRVHPCPFARHLTLGHIGAQSLAEIVQRPRAQVAAFTGRLACADCRVVAACLGG